MEVDLSSLLLPSLFILSATVCSALLLFFKKDPSPKATVNCTVLKSYPIIGYLPHFIKNHGRMVEWTAELITASPTDTATVPPMVFTVHPANIEHLSKTHFHNYRKPDLVTSALGDFLGHGILNTDSEQWKAQRKTSSHEFNTKSLRAFLLDTLRRKVAGGLVPLLTQASRSGDVLDLQEVFGRFAFDNVCSLVFGEDPGSLFGGSDEGERVFRAFDQSSHLSIARAEQVLPLWRIKRWLNIGSERRLRESLSTVHEFVNGFIRSSRGARGSDLLSRFAEDGGHSEDFLRTILVNFMLAGRDTTPSALTWFFWVLSSRADVVEMILQELRSIRKENSDEIGEFFTLEEVREMHYLHAAITEAMRLYPPVPVIMKACLEDDVMPDGTLVRKGWSVMYSAYAMGRTESVWGEDCVEFKPERWLEEGVFQPKSPFRYPVFHAGPRACLGKDLAYIQMKAVAASILERFQIEVMEERGQHRQVITLGMEGGLPSRVKERKGIKGV